MLEENKKNLKRTEALKVIYGISTDLLKNMMDLERHQPGKKGTQDRPKLDFET